MPRPPTIPERGRIGLPEIEIVEWAAGGDPKVVKLEPATRSWWGLGRSSDRFVIDGAFVLLEIVEDLACELGRPRCVLQVRPGMEGEVSIGVARMSVAQILADPALRHLDGRARLPLPNGARLRISAQGLTFLARIGGPPLIRPTLAAGLSGPSGLRQSPVPSGNPIPAF